MRSYNRPSLPKQIRPGRKRRPLVSIIIPARNESRTIGRVIRNARAIMAGTEVIAVVNGTHDRTARIARLAGARVVQYKESLGHDVGRAVGARLARGNILLFIDADFIIPVSSLRRYVQAVKRGKDVVLNSYSGFANKKRMHSTSEAKRLLNKILGRSDLVGSSLTAVPHAMSKQAARTIGYDNLAVPPKAQVKAILSGLSVARAPIIRVSALNRRRTGDSSVERLILGDHAEAIHYLIEERGERGGLTDLWRQRSLLIDYPITEQFPGEEGKEPSLSVIIMARNEAKTISSVIQSALALEPAEVIVVVNGSTDRTERIAQDLGVKVVAFPEALGHDVGRSVGALHAGGEVLLFLDGDIVIDPGKLRPFVAACLAGTDIALNDVNSLYHSVRMIDSVSMAKQFLNRMIKRPELGFASLTAVPHAMRREAVEQIGHKHLAVPPLALAIGAMGGLNVQLASTVDVFKLNRRRSTNSRSYRTSSNIVEQLILGDHVEALHWLHDHYGSRGFFPDEIRKREILK